ncbi:helix-turn-helix domain-containing protein [Phenylobacterium sp.]|uniref:helix-turn-helix domain-containing protein n=1 Tax=Phenylobacterium sp. TaxID=1871053 RepID=UPI00273268C9|nr:helix-turn-helix transcriptional regulator [Phenylobacterium sp.]MDP3853170.1 helix-turn-helix transcriptional regulator [Phenylobacterium sp.]
MTQDELATIGGVSRPRVSRYETQADTPTFPFMRRVREEALRRGLAFSGDWFFEHPAARLGDAASDEGTGQ